MSGDSCKPDLRGLLTLSLGPLSIPTCVPCPLCLPCPSLHPLPLGSLCSYSLQHPLLLKGPSDGNWTLVSRVLPRLSEGYVCSPRQASILLTVPCRNVRQAGNVPTSSSDPQCTPLRTGDNKACLLGLPGEFRRHKGRACAREDQEKVHPSHTSKREIFTGAQAMAVSVPRRRLAGQ